MTSPGEGQTTQILETIKTLAGAHKNVMTLSIPEGDDKPLKYPLMFSLCDVVLLSKIDSLSCFDFDFEVVKQRILKLNPKAEIFELSAKTGAGVTAWAEWLQAAFHERRV